MLDEKASPFTQINNIIVGNTVLMPSASFGGKNQILKPHLVVMTSNCDIRHVDTKLSETARKALISRMLVYEFCDDKFDPSVKDARQNQPHRKPDFSHIRFRNGSEEVGVDELTDVICEKLGASLDKYRLLNDTPLPDNQYMYNGKLLTVDKLFASDDTKYLHWFAGTPGSGKSPLILPHARELTAMIKVGYHTPGSLSELQDIKSSVEDVFVLDDLFDLSSETHHLLLIQWYNSLPSMCKVVCISKYGLDSINPFSNVYCLNKHDQPIDTSALKPVLPWRIGFTISAEAQCVIRTNGGWRDLEGKEFELDHMLRDCVYADSGAAYPTVLEPLPEVLPFTAKEADIWYETNIEAPGLKTILQGIMKSCSLRTMKVLMGFSLDEFDVSTMGATVSRFAYLLTKKCDKPKIYGEMFNGSEDHPPLPVKTWSPLRLDIRGVDYYVTDEQIQEVHHDKTSHKTESMTFCIVAREKRRATKAWERIYALHPPSTKTVNKGYTETILRVTKAIRSTMYYYTGLLCLLMLLVLCMSIVSKLCDYDVEKPQVPKSEFTCGQCWLDTDEITYCNVCPGSNMHVYAG